jgi:Protein of unknown function (DUF1761)
MQINWIVFLGCSFIPLIIGMVWYSKLLFANAWMQATGLTEESGNSMNMVKLFGLTILFGALASFFLLPLTIHQMGFYSVFGSPADQAAINDPNSALHLYYTDFMSKYGQNFRTFKHGAFHGTLAGIFIALPVTGIAALFEKKSFKYIAIHVGYWIVCLALMGGLICQFGLSY